MAADVQHLPFAQASFAIVASTLLLQVVPDPARALLEMHRVLRPEGLLGLVVQSTSWTEEAATELAVREGMSLEERDFVSRCARRPAGSHRFEEAGLSALLGAAGLRDIRMHRCGEGYLLLATGRKEESEALL